MTGSAALASRRGALEGRAAIIREIRRFFTDGGYLETETPLRIPAPAPESHIDAVSSGEWYLQTSPEICMKRMLAAGYPKIFQIGRCWREGERGRFHLPEFTMLEWYRAGADYQDLMEETRLLVLSVTEALGFGKTLAFRGVETNLLGGWERLTVREAYRHFAGMEMEEALERDIFDVLMVEKIEPHLGAPHPVFLCDYPASRAALARLKPDDPMVAERFELYIAGLEIANAFTELTDPVEQRERFAEERDFRGRQGRSVYPLPERFLDELPAMPSSAGIALGIDRLVMLLLGAERIDDVVAFTPEEL
jgi:elongation factor P--(R)-beta-lysine ligase